MGPELVGLKANEWTYKRGIYAAGSTCGMLLRRDVRLDERRVSRDGCSIRCSTPAAPICVAVLHSTKRLMHDSNDMIARPRLGRAWTAEGSSLFGHATRPGRGTKNSEGARGCRLPLCSLIIFCCPFSGNSGQPLFRFPRSLLFGGAGEDKGSSHMRQVSAR
jgi:hypothetical protein